MRLLKRLPNGQYQLDGPFDEDKTPPYVVLSHRWGVEEEEVSWLDMVQGLGRGKQGFNKITFCADLAAQDGVEYFWTDTCCINKHFRGEHQEAMSSMFRWYQRAKKCYVYLTDVSSHKRSSPGQSPGDWKDSFTRSEWFHRGWTLQELLAPRIVEFYSRDRTLLGDKTSLHDLIHAITGVPSGALLGDPLMSFSEKQRFDWMERRETKFEEDKVYALMSLFDVSIPIHYKEGQTSARNRLQEAIATQTAIIRDLRVTHPPDDKRRIEQDNGGYWSEISDWFFTHEGFQRWRDEIGSASMWIRGDPGKGKTMLVCRIIDELSVTKPSQHQICYFFCQATDARINSATAVLRGLLYMLLEQQPSFTSLIQEKHGRGGRVIFEDVNSWVTLTTLFTDILKDPRLRSTVFIIDALDECAIQLQSLLKFIAASSHQSTRVKWLMSSRSWPTIEESLRTAQHMFEFHLDLNTEAVSAAVRVYCERRVHELGVQKGYDRELRQHVLEHLQDNADDTFLWVALVCKGLDTISPRHVRHKLRQFPPGLDELYKRMFSELQDSDDSASCRAVLATVALAFRPLTLRELACAVDLDDELCNTTELEDITLRSGCFLTIRSEAHGEKVVRFVHQSAKDYIVTQAHDVIFPEGLLVGHDRLATECIARMCEPGVLRKGMCQVTRPGARRNQFDSAHIANHLPSQASYGCAFWAEHLLESGRSLSDDDCVHEFLKANFLHWFETLGWLGCTSSAVRQILQFQTRVVGGNRGLQLSMFLVDAYRFVLDKRYIADLAPLQVYYSAIAFAPTTSIIRETFFEQCSEMFSLLPDVYSNWSAALVTLEGHTDSVTSVAFSLDGKQLASASEDQSIRLWDPATGAALATLTGHTGTVTSIAFSNDGLLVSGSGDRTMRLWDLATGTALTMLEGHTDSVNSVAVSPDNRLLASGSKDGTVRIWNASTRATQITLQGSLNKYMRRVTSVAFSPDGRQLASASDDGTVRLWDSATGTALQTLDGRALSVISVAFSPDGTQLASGTFKQTVQVWDMATGELHTTLKGHMSWLTSVAFSADNRWLASAAFEGTVRIWNAATGAALATLEGHRSSVESVAFSKDKGLLASGSSDRTVRLWDAAVGPAQPTLEGHPRSVETVTFSPDGTRLASWSLEVWASEDQTLRLWDVAAGAAVATLLGHTAPVRSAAFSPDGTPLTSNWGMGRVFSCSVSPKVSEAELATRAARETLGAHRYRARSMVFSPNSRQLALASRDKMRVWNTATGAAQATLEGHTRDVYSIAFSADSMQLASASWDGSVRVWDVSTGATLATLEGHMDSVASPAFSPDGTKLASSTGVTTMQIWDLATGASLVTLEGHRGLIRSIAFSPDGRRLASASDDRTIRMWDTTGAALETLKGHTDSISSVAFSPDGKQLASASDDRTVRLWDAATGAALQTLAGSSTHIEFTSDNYRLRTEFGEFDVMTANSTGVSPSPLRPMSLGRQFEWIQYRGDDVLWLPHDFRGDCTAVHGDTLVVGQKSGAVSFFRRGEQLRDSGQRHVLT